MINNNNEATSFLRQKATKRRHVKYLVIAACLCLVIGGIYGAARFGLFARIRGTPGGKEGLIYMSYQGPVFPLTAEDNAENITADRSITFDFSPYRSGTYLYEENGVQHSYEHYESETIVTDEYFLTNHSDKDQTLTLLYLFAGSLADRNSVVPSLSADGETINTTLHIGPLSDSFSGPNDEESRNRNKLDSWESYKSLIEAGYQTSAFDELPTLEQPVIVYEIKDRYGEKSDSAPAPMLNMEFYIDYSKTRIMTYGFNSSTNDMETGYCARGTSIPERENPEYGESAFLIVLGEDIGDYQLNAYTSGAFETKFDNAGATVQRYESTLKEILTDVSDLYLRNYDSITYGESDGNLLSGLSKESFVGLASDLIFRHMLLSESPRDQFSYDMIENIFSETRNMGRILYLSFEVTIPERSSISLTAEMAKPASTDFVGKNRSRNGYDMVTTLGSNLTFGKQRASISNTEYVEIVNQNFGFDIAAGVTSVDLDIAQEHYWMDVVKRMESEEKHE